MSGLVTGFINMVVMSGGALIQPLIGKILDYVWDGHIEEGIPLYTLQNYRTALALIPVLMGIAVLIMPFMPETFPGRGKKIISGET